MMLRIWLGVSKWNFPDGTTPSRFRDSHLPRSNLPDSHVDEFAVPSLQSRFFRCLVLKGQMRESTQRQAVDFGLVHF